MSPVAATSDSAAFRCLLCEGSNSSVDTVRTELALHRCDTCGFVQQHPIPGPAEIESMYAEEDAYFVSLEQGADLFLDRDREVLSTLADLGASDSLLDVGAGAGFLLRAAIERGWEATGLEFSQPSIDHITSRLAATVYPLDIADAPIADDSLGVVTMSHSLEHVVDPVGTLRRAREVLRPGGLVYVAVPNWRAGVRSFLKGQISWVARPHISYFDRDSLEAAFKTAGLEPITLETRPFLGVNYALAIDFARHLKLEPAAQRFLHLGDRHLGDLIGDDLRLSCPPWRLRAVMRLATTLLALWPESLCVLLGRGQELRGIARKPA